jgi:hypothetical protein
MKPKFSLLFIFLTSCIVSINGNNACNRVGFAGPNCQFQDCSENGVLASSGTKCECDDGFQGPNCQECKPIFKSGNSNREYLCCPFYLEDNAEAQWLLIAPKIKEVAKFLIGVYTSVSCLRPGSVFYQNETSEYFLDCNCKLYVPNDKRKRMFDSKTEEEIANSINVKRSNVQPSPLEVFWKSEINKRNQKKATQISPSLFADVLITEYKNNQNAIAAATNSSKKTSNSISSVSASASSCPTSDGETWAIATMIIVIVFILLVAGTVIWCFLRHKKRLLTLWEVTQAKSEKIETILVNSKLITSQLKKLSAKKRAGTSSSSKNKKSPFNL